MQPIDYFVRIVATPHRQRLVDGILAEKTAKNIKVYQNNFHASHMQTLSKRYPVTRQALGPEGFAFFAKQFLQVHLPQNANLDEYGGELSSFLLDRPELKDLPFVPYLARLDDLWYRSDTTRHTLVPKGILSLWQTLAEGKTPDGLEVDASNQEIVRMLVLDDEFYLVGNYSA